MAAAAKLGNPHGMLSVIGLSDEKLEATIADLRSSGAISADSVCQLANYLFPQASSALSDSKQLTPSLMLAIHKIHMMHSDTLIKHLTSYLQTRDAHCFPVDPLCRR